MIRLLLKEYIGILSMDSRNGNAIDQSFIRELIKLIDEAERKQSLKCLMITSSHPRIFCSGLNPFATLGVPHREMLDFIYNLSVLYRKVFTMPKPVITVINGHALGGGCILAMAADYRIMAKGTFGIGIIEMDLGMPMTLGVMKMLEYVLGGRIAERVIYSSKRFSPEEALKLGMVDELVKHQCLEERAMEKAKSLAGKPLLAFRKNKEYLRQSTSECMEAEKLSHLEE